MPDVTPFILSLGSLCVAITGIWALVTKVLKPFRDLSARVAKLEEIAAKNAGKLQQDHKSFEKQEEVNRMLLEGVNGILQHELTGNHTQEMQNCSKRIEQFIYQKGGSL